MHQSRQLGGSSKEQGKASNEVTLAAAATPLKGISRASMAIAAFSTIVEWYDFTLYLYFSTVLARVFFGSSSGALLTTLGGFALTPPAMRRRM